jgi:hypothetical protein
VVVEIALALVLLVGAGLLLQSFLRLQQVALGFDPHNVLTFNVAMSVDRTTSPPQIADFYRLRGQQPRRAFADLLPTLIVRLFWNGMTCRRQLSKSQMMDWC